MCGIEHIGKIGPLYYGPGRRYMKKRTSKARRLEWRRVVKNGDEAKMSLFGKTSRMEYRGWWL